MRRAASALPATQTPAWARAALALLLLPACQSVFGDFTIDTKKLVVACEPNRTRCDGKRIQSCINGNEWQVLEECTSADLCNLTTLHCGPCESGTYQCNGAQPQVCGPDQKWAAASTAPCASDALCVVPEDGTPATCTPPACTAGELRCMGDRLQRCPSARTDWRDVEICGSAALCDAAAATAQVGLGQFPTCVVPTCTPGQFNCDTGSPRPCKADRTGWDAPVMNCTTGSCNLAQGDCSACAAGSAVCSGGQLSRCDNQSWTGVACGSALSCNAATATCDPPLCEPGQFRCNETSGLDRCRSDGAKWEVVDQCINRVLCDAAAAHCQVPACAVAGAKRCKGNEYQECRINLTGWDDLMSCPDSGSCDPTTGCVATRCHEGDYRCNDVALESCINGVWTRKLVCQTTQLCDAGKQVCTMPTCAPGERKCVQNVVQRCNSARNGWDDIETCSGTSVCSAITLRCEQSQKK